MNTANTRSKSPTQSRNSPTQLLVSVRDAEEAKVAVANSQVGVIDLKEPNFGSLGCPGFEVASEFSRQIGSLASDGGAAMTSIALGEVADGAPWPRVSSLQIKQTLGRFSFAKFGLSRLAGRDDWLHQWQQAYSLVPRSVSRVAVAYADWTTAASPSPEKIIRAAATVDAKVLLIDTFDKQAGTLMDHLTLCQIGKLACESKRSGMKLALAGSLSAEGARDLVAIADFLGFRGAVCSQGRCSRIDSEKLRKLKETVFSNSNGKANAQQQHV